MITLKSGLPRNGKTLSLVAELMALQARWEKHPEEARPVYVYGIPDLKLPHTVIPVWPQGGEPGDVVPLRADGKPDCRLTFDQEAIPDGALIVIDECQDFYPPRGPSQSPPAHVAVLNTHGHRNLDYVLMTQHPKLIDNAVRRLVNKHQHYRRTFGGGSAITYEWDVCSDSLEYHKAVKGLFRYPRKVFGLYKSASGFTKPSFKLPAFLAVPALAVPLGIWALPTAFERLGGAMDGRGVSGGAAAAASAPGRVAGGVRGSPVSGAASPGVPLVAGVSESAAPAQSSRLAGCIATPARCLCVDGEGKTVSVEETACRTASVELGGLIPYDTAPRAAPALPAASAPVSVAQAGSFGFNAGDFRQRAPR